jgi:hypothetical protein
LVDGKRPLEPVHGQVTRVPVPAHVVDEHVDARKPIEHFVGYSAHFGLG